METGFPTLYGLRMRSRRRILLGNPQRRVTEIRILSSHRQRGASSCPKRFAKPDAGGPAFACFPGAGWAGRGRITLRIETFHQSFKFDSESNPRGFNRRERRQRRGHRFFVAFVSFCDDPISGSDWVHPPCAQEFEPDAGDECRLNSQGQDMPGAGCGRRFAPRDFLLEGLCGS